MRIALTLLLVLSAPLALYSWQVMFDLPHYLSSEWTSRTLFTSGGLWNLFCRLITPIWALCAGGVAFLWSRPARPGTASRRWVTALLGALLVLLVVVTAFFVFVFWAWSQM